MIDADSLLSQASSTVLLNNIVPKASSTSNRLQFRSRAAHSVRIRNISWRASDNLAECVLLASLRPRQTD